MLVGFLELFRPDSTVCRFRSLTEHGWEIYHLINEEFDVEFHPVYLTTFLEKLGLSYAIPRNKRPSRPENAEEILDERVADAFDEESDDIPHNKRDGDDEEGWVVDEGIRTDGGTVLGFLDTSHPQPWDNSQQLYTVDDPHITRPLVKLDEPAVGFYAVSGESVLQFPTNQEKERIFACLKGIREQNPGQRILLVMGNYLVARVRVHAQASTPAWNRSGVSPGLVSGSQPNRAGLEEPQMGSLAVDCGERGRIPRSPHQAL